MKYLIGLIFVAIISQGVLYLGTRETTIITVTDKERIQECTTKGCTSRYIVFSEYETFENTDNPFLLKFDSSDLQGSLKEGETYQVSVIGWRVPFLSSYRNILKIER